MTYPPHHARPSPRRQAAAIAASAVTAVIVIAAGAYVISHGKAAKAPKAAPSVAATRSATPAAHRQHHPAGRASFRAELVKLEPYPDPTFPDLLDVFFVITNTSKVAGTPECTVNADSPGGLHAGTLVLDHLERIGAGQTAPEAAQVKITGPAKYVTKVWVECSVPEF